MGASAHRSVPDKWGCDPLTNLGPSDPTQDGQENYHDTGPI